MYVIKVGNYYVKSVDVYAGTYGDIELSKEIMRGFNNISVARHVANSIGGEVIKMADEVTNE